MSLEGFPNSKSIRIEETPPVYADDTSSAKLAFSKMASEDRMKFLSYAQQKFTPENLVEMYDIPEDERSTYFPGVFFKKPREEVQTIAEEVPSPLTSENTYAVAFDEIHYPIKRRERKSPEILGLIRSACSMADYNHKPYVQISFENGTRVFTYAKKGNDLYQVEVCKHPGVIDDFA